jgi:hypothetical protein
MATAIRTGHIETRSRPVVTIVLSMSTSADLTLTNIWVWDHSREARFKGENRTYTEKAAFSNCFNLFASNSCSRRFFVIAMAHWISSRASESQPIFISGSPRTLGKRW